MARFEKVNSKVVKVQLGPPVVARRGSMLAYSGQVGFTPHGVPGGMGGGMGGMGGLAGLAGGLAQRAAGEHVSMMEAHGQGEVHYGFRGAHVTVLDVSPGQQLQVEADRLLAHDSSLQSSTVFLGSGGIRQAISGAVSGQGLFTTQLSGAGSVAILSHGGTIALQVTPQSQVAVDPQAYVAALGQLSVEVSAKVGWRDAVGKGSGEAIQLKVTGQGTVYVQASEQKL
ncbi:AIM24 family protein [Motilibacter aurantiacus]|uniref:AIM24 family protein n=1 Tax=Motilibacter aurantiacus TaxID=2714955 RepID=UPI00140AC017|nr:AIM24 family protein [Motilibacter aurantiacus]